MTEDQVRELLREMRDEPVPLDSLARVRMSVAERSQAGNRWIIAAWLLAGACLVLGVLLFRPAVPAQKLEPEVIARQAEVPILRPAPPADLVKARKKAALPVRRAVPQQNVLIRIENSDDPDVVILFVN